MSTILTLTGMKGAIKDLTSLAQFKNRVFKRLSGARDTFIQEGREVVQKVVYSHPENPRYPRSGNTLASTNAETIVEGDFVITNIFLDPAMANQSFDYDYAGGVKPSGLSSFYNLIGKGGHELYPSYVRRGIFFNKKTEKRDFVAGWGVIAPTYTRLVVGAIMDFK